MKEQYETGHWIVKPSGGALTVIGVSNPMLKRQDEIAAAKEDAARKAAMYFYIQGRIETVTTRERAFLIICMIQTLSFYMTRSLKNIKTSLRLIR